jgi:hypothetical protein
MNAYAVHLEERTSSIFIFTVTHCLLLDFLAYSSTLKMVAVRSSKMSVHFSNILLRNVMEESTQLSHHMRTSAETVGDSPHLQ